MHLVQCEGLLMLLLLDFPNAPSVLSKDKIDRHSRIPSRNILLELANLIKR